MDSETRPHALEIAELAHNIGLSEMRQRSRLFALLDDESVIHLLHEATHLRFEQGQWLYHQGEPSSCFYLLLDGVVAMHDGEDREALDCMTRGAFFGELSSILDECRSTSVVAQTNVELLCFAGTAVQTVLAQHPQVRESLIKIGLERTESSLVAALDEDDFADMPATVAEIIDLKLPGKNS